MNSQRMWNLIRVVVVVSLVLQSVASFSVIPVSAKPMAAVESQAVAEPAAQNRDQFVSPIATPIMEPTVTVTPQPIASPEANSGTLVIGTLAI